MAITGWRGIFGVCPSRSSEVGSRQRGKEADAAPSVICTYGVPSADARVCSRSRPSRL